ALQVAVDDARRLLGIGASTNRPGPALVRPGGEEADQAQQIVGAADDLGQGPRPRLSRNSAASSAGSWAISISNWAATATAATPGSAQRLSAAATRSG